MRSKYNYLNYLKYLLSCTIAVGGAILCYPLKTNAAPILQIKPITWDVIGLDSNKPSNAGPDTFNIGARVCNVGDAKAANVTANFVREGTINSHITITGSSTLTIPSLPAGTSFHNPGNTGPIPANCTDFYFNAKIERVAAAFTTTQKYRIDATAKDENGNSLGTVSTPAGRQMFVEKLVEQNRNDVISFDGPTSVQVGDVVTYTISGKTSTAYEQLVFTTNFPNNIFQVLNVSTGYTQNGVSNNANYADACGWDSNPTSPTYRSCIGPANYPGGKVGNTFTTKYTVKIISTGGTSAAKISNLVYDFSGSSYHYNTDYNDATESRNINIVAATQSDLSLTKTVNNSRPSVGQNITYSIAVNNSGPDNATNVKIKDILPTGLSYVSSSDNVGGFYNPSTGIWDVGTVPKNGSATLQITAKVNTNTPITNTAQVSASDQTDPDSTPNNNNANEDDQASVTVNGVSDLTITKSHAGNFTVGTAAAYTLSVKNIGNAATSGTITVTDSLPTGLSIPNGAVTLSGTNASAWSCTASNNVITCTSSTAIAATNGTSTFNITGIQVATTAVPSVTNTATVSGGGQTNTTNDSASDPTTVNGVSDLTITKSHTGNFTVGTAAAYTLSVRNIGAAATSGTITVTDSLPTGLSIPNGTVTLSGTNASAWSCSASNNVITCTSNSALAATNGTSTFNITGIQVAATAVPSVTNTATVSGGGQTNTSNDSVNDRTTVNPASDLSLSKTHTGSFIVGQNGTYTLTVTNNGLSSAAGPITVTDTLPTGLTFVSGTGTNWTCSALGQTVTCTNPNPLASGDNSTIALTVAVGSAAVPSVRNTATVSSTTSDPNSANNTSIDDTTVNAVADLAIIKTDSPDPAIAGANLTYQIAVTNNGSSTATNATMSDPLPSGTTFQSITAPSGWNCTTPAVGSNGTVNCTNSSFAAGTANFTVVVKVDPNTVSGTTLNNTATVTSSTADTNTGNNSSSQTTTVQQSADLRLSKVSSPPSPAVGGTFDYIITVTNDGPSTATNVKVKDELPINVGYVLNTPSQGTYDSINTKEWSVGTLNPGASATLTIRAIRNTAANTVNTAEVIAADQPDPDSPHNNNIAGEDDQDSVTVPNQSVDLAVTKTVNNSTPRVGQNVTFTVTVTNPSASTVAATNVGLTDVLPAGLTYQSHTVSTGTYNSGTGVWNVGTLNSGTTATLTITATVTNSGAKTNTAQLSALDQNDPITGNNTASATVTASSLSPKISLVKRITAINGTPISGFDGTQTDPNGNGNTSEDTYWPIPFNNYLPGRIDGGSVKPDDEVEYTIYFLNSQESATNVTACDLVPPNTTFIPTGFNSASPHPIESGALPTDTGIALVLYPADATTLPNPPIPTVYLTNVADSDRGRYYAPNDPNTPASCRNISNNATGAAANTNGAIVVNVVRSTDSAPNNTLPYANSSGTPPRSYGFVRFKVRVK